MSEAIPDDGDEQRWLHMAVLLWIIENMARFEEKSLRPHTLFHGRFARWLSDLMCLQADLPQPDYGFTDENAKNNRSRYLQAVIHGYECDYRAFATFFREGADRATNT
ncbi:MAG: hypothetical protein CML13_11240 [Puniceicoccaceae bacterium]|nr:hypothetical protein [Puniceicoccaceae bacterium]|tara:strand:- start:24553 stop:24876 length:324 start_codon:yes stop_codon:yes gene_type:complete